MASRDIYEPTFDECTACESSAAVCPECDGRLRRRGGETVCSECGLVLESERVDRGPEWRSFDEGERKRTGAPLTATRHDRGLSTEIGHSRDANGNALSSRQRKRFGRLRRQHARSRCESKADRNLMHGCSEIRRLCGALGFAESIEEQACSLFRTAQGEDLLVGRSIESMAAASVYAVTRCNGLPRTLEEIGRVAVVSEDRVDGAYRTLNAELGLPAKPLTPKAYVPRLATALDVSNPVRARARRLADEAEARGLTIGVQPSGFAAACLYLASDAGRGLTQRAVADTADTTTATVRKHRDTLREHVV